MSGGAGKSLEEARARWLGLGTGRTEWDEPVHPEPPFEPFAGHSLPDRAPGATDDGVQETLLSKLGSKLAGLTGGGAPVPREIAHAEEEQSPPGGEPPEWLMDDRPELSYHSWLLPRDSEWDPGLWERMLVPLCSASFPVCLEIVATGGSVSFGWAVAPEDSPVIADAAESARTAIQPQDDSIEAWMEGRPGGTLRNYELKLTEDFVLPIHAFPGSDPYGPLVSALARTSSESLTVVQLLFCPCRNPWAESLWECASDGRGRPLPGSGTAILRSVRAKCAAPLFAVSARVAFLSSADGSEDSDQVLRALSPLDGANGLEAVQRPDLDADDVVLDILTRAFRRSGMILNARELYALVHPPSSEVGGRALRRMTLRTREAPESACGRGGLPLGNNEHAGTSTVVRLTEAERLSHVHVIGASGTGKSTLLLNCIERDLEEGRGLALLDPHGDLADAVLDRIPSHRKGDLVLFDPSDEEFPVGFNILRASTDAEKNLLASDFVRSSKGSPRRGETRCRRSSATPRSPSSRASAAARCWT